MEREIGSQHAIGLGAQQGQITNAADLSRVLVPLGLLIGALGIAWGASAFAKVSDAGILFILIVWTLMALIMGGQGLALTIRLFREGTWRVQAFEQGMVVERGASEAVWRWSEITSLKDESLFTFSIGEENGIPVYTLRGCKIEAQNGDRRSFTGKWAENLSQLVKEEAGRHMLAHLVEAYESGETIELGDLAIGRAGIGKDMPDIPWETVETVELSGGRILVWQRGKRNSKKIEVSPSAANAFLLADLLRAAAGDKLVVEAERSTSFVGGSSRREVACPYCGEGIPRDAMDCVHCGREVYSALQPK